MQYINQINILTTQLNNEKEKYKQLEQKYNQLYTNNQIYINQINNLQSELNRYKNQLINANLSLNNNINLNNEINNLKKQNGTLIDQIKNNNIEINNLKKQNGILFNQISLKDNEINALKLKLENNYVLKIMKLMLWN